jgi:hypothetical protein
MQIDTASAVLENECLASFCYFYVQDNQKCLLPIIFNKYQVSIKNKFAEIKSIQIYKNPFTKPLEIHYAVPTDPTFALTKLEVQYQNMIIEGLVKER